LQCLGIKRCALPKLRQFFDPQIDRLDDLTVESNSIVYAESRDNNTMHAKPDLRVLFNV
jgi:hypothetical protein